jgi:hypothetical protein
VERGAVGDRLVEPPWAVLVYRQPNWQKSQFGHRPVFVSSVPLLIRQATLDPKKAPNVVGGDEAFLEPIERIDDSLRTLAARVSSSSQCNYVVRGPAPLDNGEYVFAPSFQCAAFFIGEVMALINADDASAASRTVV